MALMVGLGVVLLVGVALTLRWGATPYRRWPPGDEAAPAPSVRVAAVRYLRGLAVALVGGFWAGALVTGPGVRLVMRLLAVTAGDDAQGTVTEAEEIVGEIDLGGTIGLYVFGGLLPGLLSGAIYVLVRRWLPSGRAGGALFGALHLVVAATRVDPLRPGNPDFDLVGPGWLSVASFGLLCIAHGMAVAALANRYSTALPAVPGGRRWLPALPLALPGLLALTPALAVVGLAGLVLAVPLLLLDRGRRLADRPPVLLAGRLAIAALALALLPGTVADLRDIVDRDHYRGRDRDRAAVPRPPPPPRLAVTGVQESSTP